MTRIYLDYNASAPLAPGLDQEMLSWMQADYKNPSSAHHSGRLARASVEEARREIKKLLGASDKDKLIFTSGGTESNNTVLRHLANQPNKKRILISAVEHSSVYKTCLSLAGAGIETVLVPVSPAGILDLDFLANHMADDVACVCVMLANNETGFVFPLDEVVSIAKTRGVPVVTDAVCAVGKWPIHFNELGVDVLTFSSHKFGGLKGVGGILLKAGTRLSPLLTGGPHELGLRAGTENIYGVLSTRFALAWATHHLLAEADRQRQMRARLIQRIMDFCPTAFFLQSHVNLPQTLAFAVGWPGHVLLSALDLAELEVSFGSACASGALEISRVLRLLCANEDQAGQMIRLSFGPGTTENDIEVFLQRLRIILEKNL